MKNALKIIVFVLIMGTVSGVLLVGVNSFTTPLIAKNEELKLKSAVLEVLEIPYDKTNVLDVFEANITPLERDKYKIFKAPDNSIAFEFSGSGLWGPIYGIISLESDLKTVRMIKILHQEETPGLGSRVAEAKYLSKFKSKEVIPRLVVDGITGATGTSRAFERLINENINKYLSVLN